MPGTGDVWQMVSGIASLLAVGLSIYTLVTARNRKDVGDLIEAKGRHETRLTKLESDVSHLPDNNSVNELKLSIAEMRGQIGIIVERVGPIKAIAERLQESMLEHGK